jgi:pimeloyl-ACP methyl ester carboxylesterase
VATIHTSIRDSLYITLSDGRRLGFAEYGHLRGKPILYFHGGVSCRLDIAFAADQLAEKGLKVIAPDRPGLGLSDPSPGRNLLDWAADVEELMIELELQDIPLLGWSLGTPYVYACAHALPDMFSKIACIGACHNFDSPEYVQELGLFLDRFLITCPPNYRWVARSILTLSAKAPSAMLKKLAESEVSKSPADHEVVKLMSVRDVTDFVYGSMQQGPDGIIDDYWAVREPWGFSLSEIGVDMMIYHGEEDCIAPMSGASRVATLIPGARLITVPKSGHFLLHTKFDQVIDSLFK